METIRRSAAHVTSPRTQEAKWWRHTSSAELVELMSDFDSICLEGDGPETLLVIAESLGELLDRCLAEGAFFAKEGFQAPRRLIR